MKRKKYIRPKTLSEVYDVFGDDKLVKLVNIAQIKFYASMGVQPYWIDESPYDGRLIAFYNKEETTEVWEKWKRYDTKTGEKCRKSF